jgi:hypothetical protein
MDAYCSGGELSPPVENFEELNSRWQKEDSFLNLTEARKRACEAFEKRIHTIESIPMNKWDTELERIASYDGFNHLAAHRGYIRMF